MTKIKNGELYQYGAEPFEQQQYETAGVEGVNNIHSFIYSFVRLFFNSRYRCIRSHMISLR